MGQGILAPHLDPAFLSILHFEGFAFVQLTSVNNMWCRTIAAACVRNIEKYLFIKT